MLDTYVQPALQDNRFLSDYLSLVYRTYIQQIPAILCNCYKLDHTRSAISTTGSTFTRPPKSLHMLKFKQVLLVPLYYGNTPITTRMQSSETGFPFWSNDQFEVTVMGNIGLMPGDFLFISPSVATLMSASADRCLEIIQTETTGPFSKFNITMTKLTVKESREISNEAHMKQFITDQLVYIPEFSSYMYNEDYVMYYTFLDAVHHVGQTISKFFTKPGYTICTTVDGTSTEIALIDLYLAASFIFESLRSAVKIKTSKADLVFSGVFRLLGSNNATNASYMHWYGMTMAHNVIHTNFLSKSMALTLDSINIDAMNDPIHMLRKYPWIRKINHHQPTLPIYKFNVVDNGSASTIDFEISGDISDMLIGPIIYAFYTYVLQHIRNLEPRNALNRNLINSFIEWFKSKHAELGPLQLIISIATLNALFITLLLDDA